MPSAPTQQSPGRMGTGLLRICWAEGLDGVTCVPLARRWPCSFWRWLGGEWEDRCGAVIAISAKGEDEANGEAGVAECCWSSLGGGSHHVKPCLNID